MCGLTIGSSIVRNGFRSMNLRRLLSYSFVLIHTFSPFYRTKFINEYVHMYVDMYVHTCLYLNNFLQMKINSKIDISRL